MFESLCLISLSTTAFAWGTVKRVRGQILYVPAAYTELGPLNILVEVPCEPPPCEPPPCEPQPIEVRQIFITRLVIHNLDPDDSIILKTEDFYSPDGILVKELLNDPVVVNPWQSISYLASTSTLLPDDVPPFAGNLGSPFFIVRWKTYKGVIAPKLLGNIVGFRLLPPELGNGPEFFGTRSTDAIVLEQRWGFRRRD